MLICVLALLYLIGSKLLVKFTDHGVIRLYLAFVAIAENSALLRPWRLTAHSIDSYLAN